MNEREAITALMQRTRRYWYEDGLWELATGVFFLALALFLAWQAVTPQDSRLWLVFGLGGPVVFIGIPLVAYRLVGRMKARLTYPRTGYVRYRAEQGKRTRLLQALGMGALMGLVVSFSLLRGWEIRLPLFFGAVSLIVLALTGRSLGLHRFYLLAVWSAVVGIGAALLPVSNLMGGALFWLALSLGFLISGLCTLRRYLSSAPELGEESET